MRALVAVVLCSLAPAGDAAWASPPATWTVAAGPGIFLGDGSPVLGHARIGVEAVPDRGVGVGIDAGWLSMGWPPTYGVGTVSPSVILPLRGPRASVRAGYTLAFRDGAAHLVHAGLAFDQAAGARCRLRLEIRDSMLLGAYRVHVAEFTIGIAFDDRPR